MSAVEAMKICAVICEYNPFHNGHKYLIEQAKRLSGCDAVLCIMSGNFTQRGEAAVLPKFVRAEHAVRGGADCVIQLPAAFSVAPAEVFAQGAQRRRLQELGFVPGAQVECVGTSPLGDPRAYQLRGTVIALRRRDARPVRVAFLSNTGI